MASHRHVVRFNLRTSLMAATAIAGLGTSPAWAQTAPATPQATASPKGPTDGTAPTDAPQTTPDEPAPQGDNGTGDIIVTGIRGSLTRAVDIKREAPSMVDAISAEDVGKFPDTNIAESVQRITGVQINRTRGEGRTVNIRGLPANFTLTTLNGRLLPNALSNATQASTRTFDFSIMAPEFVRTLEVSKSPTADMEDGGLAGNVNIKTPRALSSNKMILSGSLKGEYASNNGLISPQGSIIFADKLFDGRLGITAGFSYTRRRSETHQVSQFYTTAPEAAGRDFDGNGVIDPTKTYRVLASGFYSNFLEDSKRLGAIGSIEFQATDSLRFTLDGFYSRLRLTNMQNQHLHFNQMNTVVVSSQVQTLEGMPTVTSTRLANLDLRDIGRIEARTGYISNYVGGFEWKRDGWKISVDGSYGKSAQTRSNLGLANQVINNVAGSSTGEVSYTGLPGDIIGTTTYYNGFDTARLNPANFRLLSINGEFNRRSEDRIYDFHADIRREFSGSFVTAIMAGAQYSDRAIYQDNYALNVPLAGLKSLRPDTPAGKLAGSLSAAPYMVPVSSSNGAFLGSYKGAATFPDTWLAADYRIFLNGASNATLAAAGQVTNDASGIIDVREKVLAGYVRADFKTDNLVGNIGLRVVRTRQASVGAVPNFNGITVDAEGGNVLRLPVSTATAVSKSYTDWLPSFNVKYDATSNLAIRFAASRTMTRPNMVDISPSATASFFSLTIVKNNPLLDPFRSNNLDLSFEYYFGKGGLLGASFFYKNLVSLVRRQVTIQTYAVTFLRSSGNTVENRDFAVSELVNGAGVKVKGVELYYQQAFTGLPAPFDGLGTIINYTFIDNSDPNQLTAASKHNFNAIAYYEKGPIGVRFSYSWRAGYLLTAPSFPVMGERAKPYGQLDASLALKITDRFSATFEALNLTDADDVTVYTTGLPDVYTDSGRRFTAGLRFSF
ncbi:TonB-dependent receptor [Sphingomonas sp. AR_OL41]|uniref:TonB-dependent receptor n=1 Tax=Sphingomonas sp. AR_OL41 TaxID=3042729 RepID=UPI0024802F7B|nr:TonB-dependent receptor [Sphingomonas sp. AR_OL41]MDH7975324.1 TonB-dependent receptor [Sphingomonas sp. AR_OL41]